MDSEVKFLRGLQVNYNSLQEKSALTFYYCTDTNNLYIGAQLLTNGADLAGAIERISANETNIYTLDANHQFLSEKVNTLNADAQTQGSVANAVATEKQSILGGVSADYNTLKKIADWIVAHSADADQISDIVEKLDGADNIAGSVRKLIKDAVNALTGTATIASKNNNIVTLKAGLTETGGKMANSSGSDITLAPVASTGSAADVIVNNAGVTATTVQAAIKELKDGIVSLGEDSAVTLSEEASTGMLKTYNFYQGENFLGKIDIPKDFLVKSGKVVTIIGNIDSDNELTSGLADGTYLKLVINSTDSLSNASKIYISVTSLIDVYTAAQGASEVQVAVNDYTISATIVDVDAAKITYIAGSSRESVKQALQRLDGADTVTGSVSKKIKDAIQNLDATVSITDSSNPLNITITQTNGVLTSVTGSIDAETFDAYGAAEAVLGDSADTAQDMTVYGAHKRIKDLEDDIEQRDLHTPVITGNKTGTVSKIYADGTEIASISDGVKGDTGRGVSGVQLNNDYTLTFNYTDNTSDTTGSIRGQKGDPGDDYVLTTTDKSDIASLVVGMEIDDTAGDGDTDKTWSADKLTDELANAGTVKDVTVDGTSIVDSNGEAVIPLGNANTFGVYKTSEVYGTTVVNGVITVNPAANGNIRLGDNSRKPIVSTNQHVSVFYGLAKASGDTTQSQSANAVGTYTDNAKQSIKQMLSIPTDAYDLNPGTLIPASADLNAYTSEGVYHADDSVISTITNAPTTTSEYKLVVDKVNDTTINQTATLTDGKTYTRTGTSENDVWTFGTWNSVITSGDIASANDVGVAKVDDANGIFINPTTKALYIVKAGSSAVKNGATTMKPIVPYHQHESTFYGLARAAGDTTQWQSDNAVGTYTLEAKAAIRNMLGISNEVVPYELTEEDKSDIHDAVYESLVNTVTVSGTDPTVAAEENTRYICGELLSLSFTPCQSGICDIRFTSGSTLTVLTLPSTVKMPDWFEVETNHTYEISIMDGVYGTVMSWSI